MPLTKSDLSDIYFVSKFRSFCFIYDFVEKVNSLNNSNGSKFNIAY